MKLRSRSRRISPKSLAQRELLCIFAAHAADPHGDPARPKAVDGPGKKPHATDGGSSACKRHPHAPRPAEARSQGRPGFDPAAAARASDLRRDGEGFRHAPGGPEVRPREGQQDPANVQDFAEQDDRRPLGAPAGRAGRHAPPIARVFVITGPSGVGKGTLIRSLLQRMPQLQLSFAAPTRSPRPGEQHGVAYWFLSDADFAERVQAGDFVEHATYSGRQYGTLRSELERRIAAGVPVVLEIELQGARQVRAAMPEAVQIFIAPPSVDALRARLLGRGTDDPEQVEARLRTAAAELAAQDEFSHVVVNDRLEDAVAALEAIVRAELDSTA